MIIAVVILLAAVITAVIYILGSSGRELKKQLDLGHKYLIEQNYEQAIVCFKKAIEIDPMCEDAYLSMADAYVGIADLDNAMSLLEDAIKLFESNGFDATSLKDKLLEIQTEIERKRIAALPYVEIKPILECLDNLWGRKWTNWTMEDYINEFDLKKEDNDDEWCGYDGDHSHYAMLREDGFELVQSIQIPSMAYIGTIFLTYENGNITYCQTINDDEAIIEDYLYNYASKNGINSFETARNFWGIKNSGEINTDLGLGKVWCDEDFINIKVKEYEISMSGNDNNHVQMFVIINDKIGEKSTND